MNKLGFFQANLNQPVELNKKAADKYCEGLDKTLNNFYKKDEALNLDNNNSFKPS